MKRRDFLRISLGVTTGLIGIYSSPEEDIYEGYCFQYSFKFEKNKVLSHINLFPYDKLEMRTSIGLYRSIDESEEAKKSLEQYKLKLGETFWMPVHVVEDPESHGFGLIKVPHRTLRGKDLKNFIDSDLIKLYSKYHNFYDYRRPEFWNK